MLLFLELTRGNILFYIIKLKIELTMEILRLHLKGGLKTKVWSSCYSLFHPQDCLLSDMEFLINIYRVMRNIIFYIIKLILDDGSYS